MTFDCNALRRLGSVALLVFVTACSESVEPTDVASDVDLKMDSLVSAEWLSEHLDDPDLVILDCTVVVEPTEDGG